MFPLNVLRKFRKEDTCNAVLAALLLSSTCECRSFMPQPRSPAASERLSRISSPHQGQCGSLTICFGGTGWPCSSGRSLGVSAWPRIGRHHLCTAPAVPNASYLTSRHRVLRHTKAAGLTSMSCSSRVGLNQGKAPFCR